MQQPYSTYCSSSTGVIQVLPQLQCGQTEVNGVTAQKIAAYVILPNTGGTTISCPINYFQESTSLPYKWIIDDEGRKHNLQYIDNVSRFQLTIMENGKEFLSNIPNSYETRLFDYFMLDISHNSSKYIGFDCYAFVSFLADATYCPESPPFEFSAVNPSTGDIVAISDSNQMPDAIKHWALCIGDDQYISKFGKTGKGAQSLVELMSMGEMKRLYSCSHNFVATLLDNSAPWDGLL